MTTALTIAGLTWLTISVATVLAVGATIRIADRRARAEQPQQPARLRLVA